LPEMRLGAVEDPVVVGAESLLHGGRMRVLLLALATAG